MAIGNYQGGNDVVVTQFFQPMMQTAQRNIVLQQQQQQERRKEKERIVQDTNKEISKINSSGLRRADLPEFNKAWDELKELNYQLSTTKNDSEQRQLRMDFNDKIASVTNLIANSKQVAGWESQALGGLTSMVGKGNVDQARNHITASTDKPSSTLSREYFDNSQFLFKFDPTKVESAISKLANQTLANPDNLNVGSRIVNSYATSGGKRMDTVLNSTSAKEPVVFEGLSRLAQTDNQVKAYVQDIMDQNGVDFNTAVTQLAVQYGDKFNKSSTRDVSAEKPKGITVNVNTGSTTPANSVVENYALGRDPRGNEVTLKQYVQFNQSQEIGGLLKGFDPLTRKNVEAQGTANKARVLGLGSDNSGREYALVAYVPDPDFPNEESTMLINRERYLNNAKIPKTQRPYVEESAKRATQTREEAKKSTLAPRGLSGGSVR